MFVLMGVMDYEGGKPLGVFSTLDSAKNAIKNVEEVSYAFDRYDVFETDLDDIVNPFTSDPVWTSENSFTD